MMSALIHARCPHNNMECAVFKLCEKRTAGESRIDGKRPVTVNSGICVWERTVRVMKAVCVRVTMLSSSCSSGLATCSAVQV